MMDIASSNPFPFTLNAILKTNACFYGVMPPMNAQVMMDFAKKILTTSASKDNA